MVEFSESFKLDCEELDGDHRQLKEMVDEIVAMLDANETANCKAKVLEFVNFSKLHFAREELFLSDHGYPDTDKHRKHHASLDQKMEHMLEFAGMVAVNEKARESLKKELVYFLMDDVISTDLNFKSFVKS